MNPETRRELHVALAEAAEELVRYLLYAEQAYAEGYPEIGQMFERAARLEALEHAREQALLLDEVGTTEQNLRRAVAAETMDFEELYPEMARHAAAAGDEAVAVLLRDLAEDKERQATEFREAYLKLRRREAANTATSAAQPTGPGDNA